MSHEIALRYGFPAPRTGVLVRDAIGRLWKWDDEPAGLSDLGAWTTVAGTAGSVAGTGLSIAGAATGLSVLGPIGAGIGLIAGLISGIFGQHAAKVQQENKISGQWAASGPQTVDGIMSAWEAGQVDGPTASNALQQVYAQFVQQNAAISKYNGTTGAFPDPNQPRPASSCNWACGTSYDLAQQIKGLQTQIGQNPSVGSLGGLSSSLGSNPLLLGGLILGALLLFK
jgi:hypothetical protein